MKKFSLSKWILLGAALTFAYACNCQRQEDETRPRREKDRDRDDGDMCEMQTPESKETHISSSEGNKVPNVAREETPAATPSVKKAAPSPEVKAEVPVMLESKEKTVEAAPIPLENVKAVSETSAV